MSRFTVYPRTALALLLTTVAIAVPCGAWWFAGGQQVSRAAAEADDAVWSSAYRQASSLADRLGERLAELQAIEAKRPFYHYQSLFHDPEGAAEGAAVSVSPLARGPGDPLIAVHFQVDQAGRLELPTVNEDLPELELAAARDTQCDMLWKLADVAVFCSLDDSLGGGEVDRVVTLDTRQWRQHLRANELFADLKYGAGSAPRVESNGYEVTVQVGEMRWFTLPVGGEPALVALREVATPEGRWSQGFVVDREAAERWVSDEGLVVHLDPDPAGFSSWRVAAPVDEVEWWVTVDASQALAAAIATSQEQRERFTRAFLIGSLAAGLAGLLVVVIVFQSERTALQRAQFAASAAHELRTPLTGLRLYAEMLAEGLGDPERNRDYARRLAGEAERLGRVVSNVLSFTRLERGATALQAEAGDLAPAVLEAYQRQRSALEESGAAVELEVEDGLPAVRFDRDAVGHIVQNLLDNAEKYTRDVPGRRIVVRLARDSRDVVLSVADNGRGVSRRLRRRLFNPFARGGDRDAPEGLGLGLVLVRLLARAQGGDVSYHDASSGGAEFRVTFPIAHTA
ncbi:MAG: HAMP domain-containing sensor histidine kinase [Acidobacteriota bacterium]